MSFAFYYLLLKQLESSMDTAVLCLRLPNRFVLLCFIALMKAGILFSLEGFRSLNIYAFLMLEGTILYDYLAFY